MNEVFHSFGDYKHRFADAIVMLVLHEVIKLLSTGLFTIFPVKEFQSLVGVYISHINLEPKGYPLARLLRRVFAECSGVRPE